MRAYNDNDEMLVESKGVLRSEKRLVEKLFAREGRLREAQAVVNWLEENARDYLEDRKEFWSQQRVGRNKQS